MLKETVIHAVPAIHAKTKWVRVTYFITIYTILSTNLLTLCEGIVKVPLGVSEMKPIPQYNFEVPIYFFSVS